MTAYQFSQPWLSKLNGDLAPTAREFANLRNYLKGLDDGTISLFNLNALNATVGSITATGNIAMGGFKITGLGNGTAAQDAAAYGQIGLLQTVTSTYATGTTSTTSTLADTGIAITITPKVSTSRILISASVPVKGAADVNGIIGVDLRITDSANATIQDFTAVYGDNNSGNGNTEFASVPIFGVDTPGSTASKTYKVRFARNTTQAGGNVVTCYAGFGQCPAFIIAQEIQ